MKPTSISTMIVLLASSAALACVTKYPYTADYWRITSVAFDGTSSCDQLDDPGGSLVVVGAPPLRPAQPPFGDWFELSSPFVGNLLDDHDYHCLAATVNAVRNYSVHPGKVWNVGDKVGLAVTYRHSGDEQARQSLLHEVALLKPDTVVFPRVIILSAKTIRDYGTFQNAAAHPINFGRWPNKATPADTLLRRGPVAAYNCTYGIGGLLCP
jgi:hypothetical protein